MADRRRNRPANRPARPAAPLSGDIDVDAETAAALAIFNARLSQQADSERAQRRVDKATREKDQAAARVRALESDTKATVEQRNEATATYKAALDALERARRGEAPAAPTAPADTGTPEDTGPAEDTGKPGDTGPAEDTVPAEDGDAPAAEADAPTEADEVEPRDAALDEAPAADS